MTSHSFQAQSGTPDSPGPRESGEMPSFFWSAAQRAALARVARRQGAVDELEYARALLAHRKLRRALCALARVRSRV